MKITIESTSRLVEIRTPTGNVLARIWEGTTDGGIRVICLITRISVREDQDLDLTQFNAELEEHRAPSADAQAYPLHIIL